MLTITVEKIDAQKLEQVNRKARCLVQYTITMLSPERIFQHTYATAENTAFYFAHLLIVMPDDIVDSLEYLTSLIDASSLVGDKLTFSIHKSEEIDNYLDRGHLFYSSVCVAENLVYAKDKNSLLMKTP